jgi:large subunit ribosomal protein L9
MEVILRQYVEHLGKRGDVVKVAAGYARNYLLPRKLALPATDGNKRHVERERKIMEVKEADEKAQSQAIASRIEAIEVVITPPRRRDRSAVWLGHLGRHRRVPQGKGFEIDRRKLILPEPIKTIGTHSVPLKLHRDVTVTIKVQVAKEGGGGAVTPAPPAEATT